jgi:hypothetical protein
LPNGDRHDFDRAVAAMSMIPLQDRAFPKLPDDSRLGSEVQVHGVDTAGPQVAPALPASSMTAWLPHLWIGVLARIRGSARDAAISKG